MMDGRLSRIMPRTYEFIKGEAVDCIVRHDMQYPLNARLLASRMGLSVCSYGSLVQEQYDAARELSDDGFYLEDVGTKPRIYVDETKRPVRQTWTLLHEIGHVKLDHVSSLGLSREDKEKEANFFAKYIAAPPPLFLLLPSITQENVRRAFRISRQFSEYAIAYFGKWRDQFHGIYKNYEISLLSHCQASFVRFLRCEGIS